MLKLIKNFFQTTRSFNCINCSRQQLINCPVGLFNKLLYGPLSLGERHITARYCATYCNNLSRRNGTINYFFLKFRQDRVDNGSF